MSEHKEIFVEVETIAPSLYRVTIGDRPSVVMDFERAVQLTANLMVAARTLVALYKETLGEIADKASCWLALVPTAGNAPDDVVILPAFGEYLSADDAVLLWLDGDDDVVRLRPGDALLIAHHLREAWQHD